MRVTGVQTCTFRCASRRRHSTLQGDSSSDVCSFVFKQKTAYEITRWLEFRRVLFLSQAEDGIRDYKVTGVQTCALPISSRRRHTRLQGDWSSDVCSSDLIGRAHV